jgi:hypothetical protein
MRTLARNIILATCCAFVAGGLTSCGKNFFASYDKSDPDEEAMKALEEGQPNKAISILNNAYAGDRDNPRYLSLKGAALMQKYGLDIIDLALKLAASGSNGSSNLAESSGSNQDTFTTLFTVLPEASDENIDGIAEAITCLQGIPQDIRPTSDIFKLTLAETAWFAMKLKAMDTDGDGQLSATEIADSLMNNPDNATEILTMLATAALDAAGMSGAGGTGASVAEKLTNIQSGITGADGANDGEKLASYLAPSGG